MARAQQNEKPSTVRTTSSSRGARTMSKPAMVALGASALAIVWAGVELAGAGSAMYAYGFFFTEFFAGVVALVSLSLTVMLGLLATDRLVLLIRHRVLLQSAHRATGILGVAGLVVHVITKISIGRAGPTDAIVPFIGGSGLYVGLGTVASFLMVSVLWTGLIRVRFAGVGPKWFWRALHSMAYVSWPFALVHGLNAGRAANTWVVVSYLACVLLVLVALLVRFSVHLGKRSREQHRAAALNQAMAGRAEGAGLLAGLARKRATGKEESKPARGREGGWAEATATWTAPAGTARRRDPERFVVPVVPEPGSLREPVRAAAARRREEELARAGDRPDDGLAPVARRRAERPARRTEERPARRADERSTRRREERESVARRRDAERPARRYRDEEERVSRRSRAEEDAAARYSSPPDAAARYSSAPDAGGHHSAPPDTGTRHSTPPDAGSRYSAPPRRADEPEEPWDSPRRWETRPVSGEPVSAGPISGGGRHSVEEDVPEEPDYWRPPARYAAEEAFVDDTPTLVDLASRRARRASGETRSSRRRRVNADAVDGAYWAGLRGEAK